MACVPMVPSTKVWPSGVAFAAFNTPSEPPTPTTLSTTRLFLSVAKSVDFQKADHELTTGHYRDFLDDANMRFIDTDGNVREHY